ncbi:hypothetical protein AAMO2058_001448500, partial [Amorphochlora amoebiformis]
RVHLPPGDVLVHCGDITGNYGRKSEVNLEKDFKDFLEFFASRTEYKARVFIAGNHDIILDKKCYRQYRASRRLIEKLPKGITYLENSGFEFEGLRIWGSPISSSRMETSGSRYYSDAFERDAADRKQIWSRLPNDLDLLITHTPPSGTLDETDFFAPDPSPLGDPLLTKHLNKLPKPPRAHVFGHCHRDAGVKVREVGGGKSTLLVNASMVEAVKQSPSGKATAFVFDIPRR